MIRRIIKNWEFSEKMRSNLVFSDPTKIRLNSEPGFSIIMLKADSNGKYSTDADIYVETPTTNPNALKKWLKFEALVVEDPDNSFGVPAGTSLGFKVKTSAGNYYWDGASWVTAGASDWSTEAEINDNLDTFPIATVGSKEIGFVINLVTTDENITPMVKSLKLLGEYDMDFLDDLVYDGVIRTLNVNFRSSSKNVFPKSGTNTSIDLSTIIQNQGYNVTDIRNVYDLTADPLKLNNLYSSYAPGSLRQDGFTNDPGVITLSSAIPDGNLVCVNFFYIPEIYIRMNQDFFEVPTFPSIVIEGVIAIKDKFKMSEHNGNNDFIRDKPNLSAVVQQGPRQTTMRFEYAVYTNSQLDQMRLTNDLTAFLTNQRQITSFGLDQCYDLDIVEELNTSRTSRAADDTDTMIATGSFDLLGVCFFDKESIDVPLVREFGLMIDGKIL